MSRRLTAVVAIALAAATVSCGPSKPAGTTPPRLTEAPPFLAHLGAAHTTVLYVNDPLPHLDRLLASPTVSRLVSNPAIAAMRDEGPIDLAAARRTVADAAASVPREVAIGVTETGVQAFGRVMRLAVLFGLVRGSFAAGDGAVERELPALQDLLIAELRATRVPEAVIWVRMRSAEDAGRLFATASRLADELPPGVGRVDALDDAITVDVDVGSMMGGADQLAQMLPFMQLATDPDDPHIPAMVDAIRRFRTRFELRHRGDELELTIGDGGAAPRAPAPVTVLEPLFTPGSGPMVAWARWDTTSLKAMMTEGAALVNRWRDTASGKAMAADDEEDLAGDILDLDRDLARAPTRGQLRFSAGDTLALDTIEYDPPAAPPLAADVVALVPADAAMVILDGTGDIGSSMARAMSQVENRMASNWLKKAIGGGDTGAEDAMSAAYYKNFAALRQLVLRESRDLFLAPAAQVFTTAGKAELTVEVGHGRARHREVFHDLPLLEWALIGRTRDPARALVWAESVYRELVSGGLAVGGMKLPAGAKLVVARDLGLGVPTHAFTLDWVGAASSGALSIDVGGNAALHAFTRGDLFVISTSPALSRRLLGSGPRLALPSPGLVSYGRATAAPFADYLDRFGDWFARFDGDRKTKDAFAALAAAVRALDSLSWQSHDAAGTRISRAELRVAD